MTDDVLPTGTSTGGAAPRDWSQPQPEAGPALEKELAEARKEAASFRTGARGHVAEATKKLAAVAGVEWNAEQPPTMDDLVKKLGNVPQDLKAARDQVRGLQLDLHLERAFAVHGAKPMLARAYLSESGAMQKLKALDPASETYADDVSFHVAEAIESEPGLKGQSTMARRTTAPMLPGPPSLQLNHEDLKHMSPEEIDGARRAGLLDEILGRR
jgi:hypothetical protein